MKVRHQNETSNRTGLCHFHFRRRHHPVVKIRHHNSFASTINSYQHYTHCPYKSETGLPRNFIYQSPGSHDQLIVSVEDNPNEMSENRKDLLRESKSLIFRMIRENHDKSVHKIINQFMQDKGKAFLRNAMNLLEYGEQGVKDSSMTSFKSTTGLKKTLEKKKLIENKRILIKRIIKKTEELLKAKDDKLLKEAIYLINSVQGVIHAMSSMSGFPKNSPMRSLISDKKRLIKTIITKTQKLIKDRNDDILNGAISLVHRVLSKVYSDKESSKDETKATLDTKTTLDAKTTLDNKTTPDANTPSDTKTTSGAKTPSDTKTTSDAKTEKMDSHPDKTTTQTLVNVLKNITNKVDEQMKNGTIVNKPNGVSSVRISNSLNKLKQEMLKMTGDDMNDNQSENKQKELTNETKAFDIPQNETANQRKDTQIDTINNQINAGNDSTNQNTSASMDYMLNELMLEFNKFADKVEKYEKTKESLEKLDLNITRNLTKEERKINETRENQKLKKEKENESQSDEELIKEFVTSLKNKSNTHNQDTKDSIKHTSQKPEINVDISENGLEKISNYIIQEIDKSQAIKFHANIKPNALNYYETQKFDGLAHSIPNFPATNNNKRDEKMTSRRKMKDPTRPKTGKPLVRKKVKKISKKTGNANRESINLDVIKNIINEKRAEAEKDEERSVSYRYVHNKPCSTLHHESCSKSRPQRDSERAIAFDADSEGSSHNKIDKNQKEDSLSARDMTTFTIRKPKNMSLKIEMTPSNAIIMIKDPLHKRKVVDHLQKKLSISKDPSVGNKSEDLNLESDAKDVMNELVSLVKETAVESEDLISNLKSNIQNDTSIENGTLPVLTNATSYNSSPNETVTLKTKNNESDEKVLPKRIAKAYPIVINDGIEAQNSTNTSTSENRKMLNRKLNKNATYVFTDTADEGDDLKSDPQIGVGIKMLKASHVSSEYVDNENEEGSGTDGTSGTSHSSDNTAVSPHKKTVILNEAVNHQLKKELYGTKEESSDDNEVSAEGDDEAYTTLYPMQYNGSSPVPVMFTETEKNGLKEASSQDAVGQYVSEKSGNEYEYENSDNEEQKDDKEEIPIRLVLRKSKKPKFVKVKGIKIKKPKKVHFLEAYKNMDLAQKIDKANHHKLKGKDRQQMYDYYVDDSIALPNEEKSKKESSAKKKHGKKKNDSPDKDGPTNFLNEYLYEGIDTNELVDKLIRERHPALLSNPMFHEDEKKKEEEEHKEEIKINSKIHKTKKKSHNSYNKVRNHNNKMNSLLLQSFNGNSGEKKDSELTEDVVSPNVKSSNLLDNIFDNDVTAVQSKDNLILAHVKALLELRKEINATLSKVLPVIEMPKHMKEDAQTTSHMVASKVKEKKTKNEKKVTPKLFKNNDKMQKAFNNMSVHMDNVLLQETIGKNATDEILEKNLEKKIKHKKLIEKAKDLENEILLQMVSNKLNKKVPLRTELKRIQNNLKDIGDTKTDLLKQLDEQKGSIVEMKNNVVSDSVKNEIDEHAALVDEVKKDLEKKLDKIMKGDETAGPIQATSTVLNYPLSKQLIGNKTSNELLAKQIQAFNEMEKIVNQTVKELPTRPPPKLEETYKDIYPTQTDTVKAEENTKEKTNDEILAEHIEAFRKMGNQINDTLKEMNINMTWPKNKDNETMFPVKQEEKPPPPPPDNTFYTVNEKILHPGQTLREINTTLAELDQMDEKPDEGKKGIGALVPKIPDPSKISLKVNVSNPFASKEKDNKGTDLEEEESTEQNFYTKNKHILNPYQTLNEINATLAEIDEAGKNDTENNGLKGTFNKILPVDNNQGQYNSMGPYQNGSLLDTPAFDEMNKVINNTIEGMFNNDDEKYSTAKESAAMFNKPHSEPDRMHELVTANTKSQSLLSKPEPTLKSKESATMFNKPHSEPDHVHELVPSNTNSQNILTKPEPTLKSVFKKKEGEPPTTSVVPQTQSPVMPKSINVKGENAKESSENKIEINEKSKNAEKNEQKVVENKKNEDHVKEEQNLEEQKRVKEALSKMMYQQVEVKQLLSKMLNETEEQRNEKNKGEELLSKLIEVTKKVKYHEDLDRSRGIEGDKAIEKGEKTSLALKEKDKNKDSKIKKKKEKVKKLKKNEDEIKHLENEQDKKLKLAYLKLVQGNDEKEHHSRHNVKKTDDESNSGSGQSDLEPTMDRIVNLITTRFGDEGKLSNVFKGIENIKHHSSIAASDENESSGENEEKEETIELMGELPPDEIPEESNHKTSHKPKRKHFHKQKHLKERSKNHTLGTTDFDIQGIDVGIPNDVTESINHFYSNKNTKTSHTPRVELPELTTQNFNSTHDIRYLDFAKLMGKNKGKISNITTNQVSDESPDVDEKASALQESTVDPLLKPDILLMEKGMKSFSIKDKNKNKKKAPTTQADIEKMYDTLIDKINGDEGMKTNLENSYEHDENNKNVPPSAVNDIAIISSAYKDDRGKKEKLAKDVLNPQKKEADILLSSFPDSSSKYQKKTKKPLPVQEDTETSSLPMIVESEIKKMFNSGVRGSDSRNRKHINDTLLDSLYESAMTVEKNYNLFQNLTAAKRSASIRPVKGRHRNSTDPYATIGDNIFVPFG